VHKLIFAAAVAAAALIAMAGSPSAQDLEMAKSVASSLK
jgi:hypothetical protein